MSQVLFDTMINHFSNVRMAKYIKSANPRTNFHVVSLYFYNIKVCESLYPIINILEISLRNNIHNAFSHEFGSDWLDQTHILHANQIRKIDEVKQDFAKVGIINPTTDEIISELSLGFWVGLFNKHYENIWRRPNLIVKVFPRCPKPSRNRTELSNRLNPFKDLRNKVFHHEHILDFTHDLKLTHNKMQSIIKWISNDLYDITLAVDTFPEVLKNGQELMHKSIFSNFSDINQINSI